MKKWISETYGRIRGFVGFFWLELCLITLISFCGAFLGMSISMYGSFGNPFAYVVSNLGWIASMIAFAWVLRTYSRSRLQLVKAKIEIMNDYNEQLRRAKEALDRAYGYDEKLDKTISIYSKLIKSVGSGTANALVNFALTTNPDDTIFLIRVNHGVESWHFQVAGRPIHLDQAKAIMLASMAKIETIAGPDSLIQKKGLVQN